MERREFLKQSAMAAAIAALGRPADPAAAQTPVLPPPPPPPSEDGVTWDKAPCRFCGTGCHVQVGVKNGRVVAIAGDRQAEVNKGLLCVKGYHVGLALYGKDRLTTPLLRKDGRLTPISWEQAIDTIAQRIAAAPERFAFYGSGQWTIPEGYAAQKLMKAGLGSNHIDPNARLCMSSAVTGFMGTYGVDEPASCFDDLDACDVVIVWGNNPAEMHPVLFSRLMDRRSRGQSVTLIDIGTRRTRTTSFAQHYLEFRPNTDLAIANCIAHQLVSAKRHDAAFVERHCAFRRNGAEPSLDGEPSSFAEYAKSLEPYTPEHVEKLSGVPARELRMLGTLFADPKQKIVSLWCMGMNQHTRGTAINQLVHGIHLLSGHFGHPGDGPQSLTGQPSACGTAREVGTLCHALPGGLVVTNPEHREKAEELWRLPKGRIKDTPGHHTVKMWEAFSTPAARGGDIDTIWVQCTNPGQSLPNLGKLFDPSRKLSEKFLIASDVYPTATTRAADLVLPSALWVEKNGMVGNSERRTQQWFRQVQPPGQARDDAWQTIAVAHRLLELGVAGMRDEDGRFLFHTVDPAGKEVPIWKWERYYDVNVDQRLFDEYRAFSRWKHKDLAPYGEYVKACGLRWPVIEGEDGVWRETRYRFVEGEDPYVAKGKGFAFYHSTTKNDRAQIWFHPYEPPPEVPDAQYPFWLCTGRVLEHWHTGSITMRIPQLQRAMPNAYVEMHRDDARALGVGNGELVALETRRGRLELPLWLDGRGSPPRGSLFVPFFDEALLINALTLDAHDPISKQPDYKKCAARVAKLAQPAKGASKPG